MHMYGNNSIQKEHRHVNAIVTLQSYLIISFIFMVEKFQHFPIQIVYFLMILKIMNGKKSKILKNKNRSL